MITSIHIHNHHDSSNRWIVELKAISDPSKGEWKITIKELDYEVYSLQDVLTTIEKAVTYYNDHGDWPKRGLITETSQFK